MKKEIIRLKDIVLRLPELQFAEPIDWTICEGEQWAVVGPNGAGKTLLAGVLQKKYAFRSGEHIFVSGKSVSEVVKSIAFKDIYSLADCRNSYYQQRWHSTETEDMPTVSEVLSEYKDTENLNELLSLFGISDLLPKKLIFLSSGELRKFLVVRTLLSRPEILILDNPFIGLDAPSRYLLVDMLEKMTELHGTQVILLLSNPADLPDMILMFYPFSTVNV